MNAVDVVQTDPSAMTLPQLVSNGYVMAGLVLVSAVAQGTLSQASTHLVNVEGIRLKTALQVGLTVLKLLSKLELEGQISDKLARMSYREDFSVLFE